MPITDYDGQLQTIARNLGEEPALTNTDGLLEAIAKGTENIITEDKLKVVAPVGVVQAFAGSTSPDGWLLCDGSAVSRTDYADLYAVVGDTYGAGDGSTTFNLPDLVDKFVQGNATAGTVKSAGLPNITGYLTPMIHGNYADEDEVGGAFSPRVFQKSDFPGNIDTPTSGGNYVRGYGMNASLSSSVYGNSTTVQPPAVTMRYIIKY